MPSLQARLASLVLRLQGKADLRDRDALLAAIPRRRARDRHAPRRAFRVRHHVRVDDVHGHPCYTLGTGARALIYLHGGCYTYEITAHHWRFLAALAPAADLTITVPIYPLAPEHDHREAFAMLDPLVDDLARAAGDRGLALAGDSAGGGLALALAQRARDRGVALRALALISPWVDLEVADPDALALDRVDAMLAPGGLRAAAALWARGARLDDPALSPIHGAMAGLPPTAIAVGGRELLLPDARRLRAALIAAGVTTHYLEEPALFHDWPLVLALPEARRALAYLAARI